MTPAPPSPRPAPQHGPSSPPTGGPAGVRPAAEPSSARVAVPRRPSGPGRSAEPSLQALESLCRGFAQLYLEVEAGRRPRAQLQALMTWSLYAQLSEVWIRGGPPGRVLRVHGQLLEADRFDAVAVVRRGSRIGALAIRLRRSSSGWRVEEAIRPEDGRLPPPAIALPHSEPDSFDLVDRPLPFDAASVD